MSKLITGEDYRPIHKWKYLVLKPQEVEVDIPQSALFIPTSEYITLFIQETGFPQMILKVHTNYAWDGASFIARDTPNIMRASLFHDALTQLIGEGLLNKKYRKYADDLFRQHCLEDGMSKFRAWYVWVAVRANSKLKGM